MTLFRRKRLPPELEAPFETFERVLAEVEPAKEALTEAMPTTRLPGRPRPDALAEFEERLSTAMFVSATPGPYERRKAAGAVVEQVIRPTGLVDPAVVRITKNVLDKLGKA